MAATRQCFQAFTLSELLMALALLGLVATFTMPKVLQTTTEQQHKAKFKETIALIEQIGFEAYQSGQAEALRWDYFIARVNAVKVCNGDGVALGCMAAISGNGALDEDTQRAFVLPTGVVVGGINPVSHPNNAFTQVDHWIIDVNGLASPNTYGQDILWVSAPRFDGTGTLNPGCENRRLVCPRMDNPLSVTTYNTIYR